MIYKEHLKGWLGELFMVIYFSIKFHRLIRWRYKSRIGEIDLIFQKGRKFVFVEVKVRSCKKLDIDAGKIVTKAQMDRIQRSCEYFMQKNQDKYQNFDYCIKISVVTSVLKLPFVFDLDDDLL